MSLVRAALEVFGICFLAEAVTFLVAWWAGPELLFRLILWPHRKDNSDDQS